MPLIDDYHNITVVDLDRKANHYKPVVDSVIGPGAIVIRLFT